MLAKDSFSIVTDSENTCSSSDKALIIRWVRYNQKHSNDSFYRE